MNTEQRMNNRCGHALIQTQFQKKKKKTTRKFFSPFRRFGFVYKYFNGRDFRSQVLNPHVNPFVFELLLR